MTTVVSPSARAHNLRVRELAETLERARLGGFFYPIASALAFLVTTRGHLVAGVAVTVSLLVLALARLAVRMPLVTDAASVRRASATIWTVMLAMTVAWGAFSAWGLATLPMPAPIVVVLFSGAFGMAIAHTLCMQPGLAAIGILAVMLPSQVVLWREVSAGVGATWTIYTVYMGLVMLRSHREYRQRLELEEDLREQRDLFERRSKRDDLTGLANRRLFGETMDRVLAGDEAPVSLLILDIDHFKRINDGFGHVAGDACLSAFAHMLATHFSEPGDLPARLGGEEFGVLLHADAAAACARAEAFRAALSAMPLAFDGDVHRVTVSIGAGSLDRARHGDADAFYRDVDAALYRAKMGGRDRTELAMAETAGA